MASGATVEEEQPNYKTLVLKVSIHCEACKRKVAKILSKIEGVDSVDVDTRQNKVTFKSLVDAQTVIQKLKKHGKPAELLLEVSPIFRDRKPASETEKPPPEPAKIAVESSGPSPTAEAGKESPEAETVMAVDNSVTEAKEAQAEPSEPKKPEMVKPKTDDKNIGNSEKAPESGEEEKSKKIENNKERNGAEFKDDRTFPPQPTYVMSYNMAHPSMSQSHYVPPTISPQGHIYDDQYQYHLRYYNGPVEAHPNPIGYMHQPAIDPYNIMFSDENPNSSCSLM